ncbi:MAG: FAD binding domain-containing protein [Planctomycetota bacterium]
MKPFRMALPRTLDEATASCSDSFAKTQVMAGGTDLLGELKERTQTPGMIVNLKSLPGLGAIEETADGLAIGALAKLNDIAADPRVRASWPALVTTIGRAATPQLRNVGTLGGNLCQRPRCHYYRDETFPCLRKGGQRCYAHGGVNEHHAIYENGRCAIVHPSNTAPVLIAHDAVVEIAAPGGTELRMLLEDFFVTAEENVQRENVLKPGQIVTRILLPKKSAGRHCAYDEAREKQSFDWALCGATVRLRRDAEKVTDARVVLSAVAPRPLRRIDLEQLIVGKTIDDQLVTTICSKAVASATPMSDNKYKRKLVEAMLGRALRAAWKGEQ